jgi:alpha-L-rhamnosidase
VELVIPIFTKIMKKPAGLTSFFLFFCFSHFATEMEISPEVKGIWLKPNEQENSSFSWQASWIWLDEKIQSDAMLARRTFQVDNLPDSAILRITASSQYQLYVNSQYVCRGPARCAPHHQAYDILNISGLLMKGKNSIAVRVHHQKGKFSYHSSERAGLLAQLDGLSGENSLVTDSNWKVSPDLSWDNEAPKINRFQQVVVDRVDMRKQFEGWIHPEFEDSNWAAANPLIRNEGWPAPQKNEKPQPLINPWTALVPRDIPYLIESDCKVQNLIQAVQINEETSIPLSGKTDEVIQRSWHIFQTENKPLEIPVSGHSKNWFLLFDFGEIRNGMPSLDIQGSNGTVVDVVCAPFVLDHKFSYQLLESEYLDRIVLSGKRDKWEATYFKPARYMGIIVRGGKVPVKIFAAGIHQIEYPFSEAGTIHSADATWVKKYMDATAKTIRVCTTDTFTDNYRERRQYAQTGYYASLGNYWIFGDKSLQRRYLVQVAQEQEANGIMPAYAPLASDDYMVIIDSNCMWIRSLHNYLLYSGDYQTVKELLPSARKLMALLKSYTNTFGMIDDPPYPYWLDHALLDRRGANMNLNGHYLGALEGFAQVLYWLKEPDGKEFQKCADQLRQSLRTNLWDGEKQLFADALIEYKRSDMFSEHSNAMALALNVATPEQARQIAKQLLVKDNHNYIKRESGIIMVTPAMSYFLHKGLCQFGYIDESLQLFQDRFDKMLAPEFNGTLWEEWWLDGTGRTGKLEKGRTRSDAQTESAFVPALFAEYLLGINPTQPGMKEIKIVRSPSGLKNIEGTVPTPEGRLLIKWNIDINGNGELEVNVPGEIHLNLDLESLGMQDEKKILVDGHQLDISLLNSSTLSLSDGNHIVKF